MKLLVFITVGYIIGCIWGLYFKQNIIPMLFLCILILYIILKRKEENKKRLFEYVFLFSLFVIIANIQTKNLENKFIFTYEELENIDNTEIIGIVKSNPKEKDYKTEYIIQLKSINKKEYQNVNLKIYVKKETHLEYGKKIKLIR